MPTIHARTLRRAAEIVGGVQEMAAQLDVPSGYVAEWSQGTKPVPQEIFLKAVDIVTAHEVNEISGKHPTIKAGPSTDQGM
jgi:DNA-binding transcriptional regulator YdaS (Cro superfamily)